MGACRLAHPWPPSCSAGGVLAQLTSCSSARPGPAAPAQAQAARFVEYIRSRKTVALEELAAEFGMRTQVGTSSHRRREVAGTSDCLP